MSNDIIIPFTRQNSDNVNHSKVWQKITTFIESKSENTQRTYASIVKEWCQFLGYPVGSENSSKAILNATDLTAIAYKRWLDGRPGQAPRTSRSSKNISKNKGLIKSYKIKKIKKDGTQSTLTGATLAKKFAALRKIYKILINANIGIYQNPFNSENIPTPSAKSGQKRPTEMIDYKFVKKMLSLPDTNIEKGVRDLALLSALFGGGLRRSEVANLKISDFKKTTRGTFYLQLKATKSKKDFNQAIPRWAAQNIQSLVHHRLEKGACDGDFLFVSFRGKGGLIPTEQAISTNGIYNLFKDYCLRAGGNKFASPHSARATAITKLLDNGLSHREVQEFSRHSSVSMVEVYDKRRIEIDENPGKDLDF